MKRTNATDTARIELLLAELRLPAMKLMWADLAARADKEGWPAARFLAALAEHEIADRSRRRIERHLAGARLPTGKTFDTFDFNAVPMISKAQVMAIAAGDSWLDQGANVMLFGPPGGGKSHVAAALGLAVQNGRRVQLFGDDFQAGVARHPCDVPARAREARDEPDANRIANGNHDDGDRLGGVLGCRHPLRPPRYDEVHLEPDQLGRQVGQPVDPILRISIVDDNILALNPPELAQPLPERVEQGRPIGRGRQAKKTYPRHLSRLLLCTHTHGARDRTTNKRNELPPPHEHLVAEVAKLRRSPPSSHARGRAANPAS
jgi:energy-coupling factor transporter ATP-binding protein EcfA2